MAFQLVLPERVVEHPGEGSSNSIVFNETPSGIIDGINNTFVLAFTPSTPDKVMVFLNGLLRKQAADFILSGSTIIFNSGSIPSLEDNLLVTYEKV